MARDEPHERSTELDQNPLLGYRIALDGGWRRSPPGLTPRLWPMSNGGR